MNVKDIKFAFVVVLLIALFYKSEAKLGMLSKPHLDKLIFFIKNLYLCCFVVLRDKTSSHVFLY